ncbi:hypothetical protein K439DRAFT_1628393 [Ramaria rubella]|nr:hypothetical protein K439DRAFT_1628393 [Ramaria rubella]
MSEPGQGGYWQVNHNAPPSNRARKRNIKRLESPLRTGSSVFSPIDPSTYTSHVASIRSEETSTMITTLGGPSSLFRSVPTDSLPRGRMHGMNERCIVLPALRATNAEIFPSSPRRWTVSSSNNIQLQNYPNILSQRNYTGDRGTRLSDDDLTARLALPRRGRDLEPINLPGFNQISTGVRSINERDYHQQRIGNTASQYPLQRT